MSDPFEDHCWKDVVSADVLDVYAQYRRELRIGPKPALLAVDLYELVYQGGPRPVAEVSKTFPMSCGESTSGCVRATVVEGFSHGFQVVLVEECCFDRSVLSHKVNLFDMRHKYADVMGVDAVVAHLRATK